MSELVAILLIQRDAFAFIERHHRHHDAPRGFKFAIVAMTAAQLERFRADASSTVVDYLFGVVTVGRPVARERQDGFTAEITRLCTDGVERKVTDRRGREHVLAVASFLEGRAVRCAFAMGYLRIGSYILRSERGTTVKAAGFRVVAEVKGRSWDTPSRRRVDRHPTEDKILYERGSNDHGHDD